MSDEWYEDDKGVFRKRTAPAPEPEPEPAQDPWMIQPEPLPIPAEPLPVPVAAPAPLPMPPSVESAPKPEKAPRRPRGRPPVLPTDPEYVALECPRCEARRVAVNAKSRAYFAKSPAAKRYGRIYQRALYRKLPMAQYRDAVRDGTIRDEECSAMMAEELAKLPATACRAGDHGCGEDPCVCRTEEVDA